MKKIAQLKILLLLTVLVFFVFFSKVLQWNETRSIGMHISDWILDHIGPYELHLPIFLLTYGMVAFGLFHALREDKTYIDTMLGIIAFIVLRTATLSLFPLFPPEDIIPLKDVFLTNTFYGEKVLKRDLFFSGHTAALFLLAYINQKRWIKNTLICGGCLLGIGLLLQHVHYTIDVIAAPFFAWLAYSIGYKVNEAFFFKYYIQSA